MEAILETKAETILQFIRGLCGSLHVKRQPVLTSCFPITVLAETQRGSLGFVGPRELCPYGDCQYPL
jgi:hypothetical protein